MDIPDRAEALALLGIYADNPIIDMAESALRCFGADLDVDEAADLIVMWAHYPQLQPREVQAVLARFVDVSPDVTPREGRVVAEIPQRPMNPGLSGPGS